MATPKTVEEILKSDPFYSPDTNLDLSGHPAFYRATIPPAKPDPFEPRDSGVGPNDLRKFIENETAEKTPPSTVHVGEAEFRVYYHESRWHAVGVAAGLKHHVTGKDREEILDKLVRLGQRVEKERDIHELDAEQLRTVAWMAQSGNVSGALAKYIEFAVPNGNEIGAEK